MNLTDLFIVAALVSALYAVVVVVARQRRFLVNAVNPHRAAWLITGVAAIWSGFGLLYLETHSWEPAAWGHVLSKLFTDDSLPPRAKAAAVAIIIGALFIALVVWCVLTLPRDPSTFRRPEDRARAFQYYVCKLRRGLDYATLAWDNGERVEEAIAANKIQARLEHLPRVEGDAGTRRVRTADDQLQFWRETAVTLHQSMKSLDNVIGPARQGTNRRLVFDPEFGGIFFIYLRVPDSRDPAGDHLYLFAATLNQEGMNDRQADECFGLLLASLRNIDDSIRVS